MNKIAEKQNEIGMLQIQYCARHCYNIAGILNGISWLLCLISSVVLNLPCISNWLESGVAVAGAIVAVVVIVVDFWKKHLIKMGAAFKKLFDYGLFGFETSDDYNGFCEKDLKLTIGKIITRYHKSYQKQISHSGTDKPKGVKDWYNNILSELSLDDAIQKCQQENLYFDTSLVAITQWSYIVSLVLIIIVLMVFNSELPFFEVFINMCSMISLLIKIVMEIFGVIKLKITLNIIQSLSHNSTLEPQVIQKMIDERRNVDVPIPAIIYKIKSGFLHLSFKNADSINI